MKKLTLLVTCLFFANFAKSAILRCNNNPTVLGTYLTAQAAHDAAIAGDTIHLEPTNFGSYGNLSITKKIVLISTGNFLNQNPGIQANNSSGYCDRIDIISGGENSVISAKLNGRIFVEVSNVFISNTYCQDVQLGYNSGAQINNVIISKCFLYANGVGIVSLCSDIIISNNYLNGIYMANPNSSATITYNVIENPGFSVISNSIISNNIFYSAYAYIFPNSTLLNNVSNKANELPNGNGNLNSVDMSTVFINWGTFNGDNYQLLPTYPNQNIGMFAGPDPYKLATTPSIPSIYQLTVPAQSNSNNLNILVSTKVNN